MSNKNWIVPDVVELNVADTQFGGDNVNRRDNTYLDKDGVNVAAFAS